jgi:GNAT superfamily N-acetyltransferase
MQTCGRIIFTAFDALFKHRNFPLYEFPVVEAGIGVATNFIDHPVLIKFLAEVDKQIVGCAFLDPRDKINAIGPVAVLPDFQGCGVGKLLMEKILKKKENTIGTRLLQDTFNPDSFSLYSKLGFEFKELVTLLQGKLTGHAEPGIKVRPLSNEDLAQCKTLCVKVHGIDRTNELRDAIKVFKPLAALHDGQITGYMSAADFWQLNHAVALNEDVLKALLLATQAMSGEEPILFLLPVRYSNLMRWVLNQGGRSIKSMALMAMGKYDEPNGVYLPSISY